MWPDPDHVDPKATPVVLIIGSWSHHETRNATDVFPNPVTSRTWRALANQYRRCTPRIPYQTALPFPTVLSPTSDSTNVRPGYVKRSRQILAVRPNDEKWRKRLKVTIFEFFFFRCCYATRLTIRRDRVFPRTVVTIGNDPITRRTCTRV